MVQTLQSLPDDAPQDLCCVLLEQGQISAKQATLVRSKTVQVLGPRAVEESGLGDLGATGIHSLLNTQAIKRTGDFVQLANVQRPPTERLTESDLQRQTPPNPNHLSSQLLNSLGESGELNDMPLELLPEENKLQSGQDFNDYSLLGELSRGAMGVIFKANHHPTNRIVALKFILDSPQQDDIEQRRFQREAQALIQLKHPNIVEIFDYGRAGNRQFLAMQLIDGKDLHSTVHKAMRFESAPPPWEELLSAFLNIAEALQYCHERNVVHRDVKPSNIILEKASGKAVLVDFGLIQLQSGVDASGEEDDVARLTKTQEIVGTPQFMSPEQFSPNGSYGTIGPKTDVWSLAATMFFAMTGDNAFPGRTMIEIFDAVSNKSPQKLKDLNPDIPEWLSDLCNECFCKHVQDRPDMDRVVYQLRQGSRRKQPVEEKPFKTPILALSILTGLIAIIFTGVLLSTLASGSPPSFVSVDCPTALTQEKSVEVHGWTNEADIPVRVTNKIDGAIVSTIVVKSGASGAFRQKVLLDQGSNTIVVNIDLEETPQEVRQFVVPRDSIPPSLEIDNPQKGGKYFLEVDHILRGRVFDAGGVVQFLVDGRPIQRNRDGSFSIKVDYRSRPKTLRLTSFDKAKNSSDSTIVLVTQRDYERFYKKD
ncbi:MAG: serine/threonine-protein kinase [Planctomycetota bacterium]|nr:serine/threonine-protein kinase [Planctomycetota bacterium]